MHLVCKRISLRRNANVHIDTSTRLTMFRSRCRSSLVGCACAVADSTFQLQSQVMVLGESASASERNTSMVLSRLAALEVRIGSIPVVSRRRDVEFVPGVAILDIK